MFKAALLIIGLLSFFVSTQAQSIIGTWEMSMKNREGKEVTHTFHATENGYTVDLASDGKIEIEGKYELANGQITIWDVGGDPNFGCPEEAKGVYKLAVTEKEMRWDWIEDACEGRGSMKVWIMTRK